MLRDKNYDTFLWLAATADGLVAYQTSDKNLLLELKYPQRDTCHLLSLFKEKHILLHIAQKFS